MIQFESYSLQDDKTSVITLCKVRHPSLSLSPSPALSEKKEYCRLLDIPFSRQP